MLKADLVKIKFLKHRIPHFTGFGGNEDEVDHRVR